MIKIEQAVINLQKFISGILFYSLEYSKYLNIPIILNNDLRKFIPRALEKYNLSENDFNIIYYNDLFFLQKALILDICTFKYINKKFIAKKYFYNYGNDINSLKIDYSKKKFKNIITFGDKEIGCKVQYHYPLCLNFKIFKKDLNCPKNNKKDRIFIENKSDINSVTINGVKQGLIRNRKNFFCSFDILRYQKENIWERANRLIPECKFYNKKIQYINKDTYIDSSNLRFERDWKDYDVNNFISFDTNKNFKDFYEEL